MEELEVLIKKQEQVEKDINSYQAHVDAHSSNIINLKDRKIDLQNTYKELKEEYDKVKDSKNDADKQKAQELRIKIAKTTIEFKNIKNNLISEHKSITDLKKLLDFEKIKNDNLKEQIANHPETKVVETTQLEKELHQKLSKAKEQKKKIEEGLNKEIKSINDIDPTLIAIVKNNPSYKHYDKLLSEANARLDEFKKNNVKYEYIVEIENRINSLKSRQLTFAIDELRKESLKQDVIIDNAYDHIKELTISRAEAYNEIDSMRNGKVDQNTNSKDDKDDKNNDSDKDKDNDTNKDNDKDNDNDDSNSSNQNKNENKDENKEIDDDAETKAGKPAKRSFFKKIFSKASEIINKIKDRLPKSKAKKEEEEKARKEQEQKEQEEKARKEQEQKEQKEKARKEQEQKEQEEKNKKEQEEKDRDKDNTEQKEKKYNNRHYDENDFNDNEIYKKRVDEYLDNFEKKVKNAQEEAVRYHDEHDFDDQNLN